ncbi:MAG TPA: hypothetical protein VKY59_08185 [Spirillospora sp.]|nr:hypothetical protein [Spirillospora sp.]
MKLIPMERITIQTLLGIRFWDRLLERPVTDGLYVRAQRISDDLTQRLGRVVIGQATGGGVIAFSGLHPAERVSSDPADQMWENPPAPRFVVVDVVDRRERYLPLSFVVRIPLDERGPFRGRGNWLDEPLIFPPVPDGEEPGVYLWSAPGRPALDGRAMIYAQIVVGDGEEPEPAPYALVTVTAVISAPPARGRGRGRNAAAAPGPLRYAGIADENGILTLPLPYPPVAEPEGDHYLPLREQAFGLNVTVHYQPDQQTKLPGSDVPNLAALLTQAQAQIGTHWNTDDPPALQTDLTLEKSLRFGQPLILRTAFGSADADETESFLRIVPV